MCTWAGYVGTEPAAPILLEMGRRQEGLWSGYYSGLATLSGQELHLDKVVGPMSKLEAETDVLGFPGTMGLVHSRTNSGGGRAWGQPFMSSERTVVCCAQGSLGRFDPDLRVKLGDELLSIGRSFASATPGEMESYPTLQDGSAIHSTEMAGEAVEVERLLGASPQAALRTTMTRMPTEAVYAFMLRYQPGRLYVANVNQRAAIGRDETGTYIASSALAFPESVRWRAETSGNTIVVIEKDSVQFEPLASWETFPVEESFPAGVDEAILAFIRENAGCSLSMIVQGTLSSLIATRNIARRPVVGYQAIERLLLSGAIRSEEQSVPGVGGEGTAPRTVFFAVE